MRTPVLAAEKLGNIPAKLGGALCARAAKEPLRVIYEQAPPMGGNAQWARSSLEDFDALNPFDRRAVRRPPQTLRIAEGSLRGPIRGGNVIGVHWEGDWSGDLRGGPGW